MIDQARFAPVPMSPPGAGAHPAPLRPVGAGFLLTRPRRWAAALFVAALCALPAQAEPRFVIEPGYVAGGPARWLAVEGHLVAFGSGTEVVLARGESAPLEVVARLDLDRPIDQAVLVGERLWIAGSGSGLSLVALGTPEARARQVDLDPPVRGRLRLARSDDHLFVAEDGLGLRIVRLPGHETDQGHDGHGHAGRATATSPRQDGLLEIDASFNAVAAAGRRVWLALAGGGVLVVDVIDRKRPRIEGRVEPGFEVLDLAANGETLYALDSAGTLRVLEPGKDGAYHEVAGLDVPGASELDVAGRTVRFAAGDAGVATARDDSSIAAVVNVSVGDNFFSPASVSVNVGDTVTWSKPSTSFSHNVESCDGTSDPAVCGGNVAAEGLFRSGAATTAAFNFSRTFGSAGTNPYFCVIHSFAGMSGQVDVAGGPAGGPPPVPDGRSTAGSQVLVSKLDAQGETLSISWDTTSCPDAVDYHIIYGRGSQIPTVPGGAFATAGGACTLGSTSPFVWNNVPDPSADSTRMLWWLVLANDGKGTEGSWSPDSADTERTGPGPDGSSAQCGISAKDVSNTCGL